MLYSYITTVYDLLVLPGANMDMDGGGLDLLSSTFPHAHTMCLCITFLWRIDCISFLRHRLQLHNLT